MKWLMFILLSSGAFAKECALYELQGEIAQDRTVRLTVNSGTNSQKVFVFSREIEFSMGPYIQKTVRGRFVTRELEILKIEDVKIAVPDPLYHHNEMVKLKTVPCPKPGNKKGRH